MTGKPDGEQIVIGPNSKFTFVGGALLAFAVGVWVMAGAFFRLEAKMDEGLSKLEFSRWTIQMAERAREADHFNRAIDVPVYWPPRPGDPDGGGK
jgi:hypothetical protein